MRIELFGRRVNGLDSISSKVPVILAETTPGDEVPSVPIVGQSQGFDFSTRAPLPHPNHDKRFATRSDPPEPFESEKGWPADFFAVHLAATFVSRDAQYDPDDPVAELLGFLPAPNPSMMPASRQ